MVSALHGGVFMGLIAGVNFSTACMQQHMESHKLDRTYAQVMHAASSIAWHQGRRKLSTTGRAQ